MHSATRCLFGLDCLTGDCFFKGCLSLVKHLLAAAVSFG